MKGQAQVAVTAGQIAVALVAACRLTGRPPEQVFEEARGNMRTRVLAAAGCLQALGLTPKAAARLFQVRPNRLAPSMLRHDGVEPEAVLAVAEALTGGVTGGVAGDVTGPPPRPAAASTPVSSTHKPAPVSPPADGPKVATSPEATAVPQPAAARPPAPEPRARTAPAAVPANPVRRAGGIERLKPVSDNMVRWCRLYLARGVTKDDLADLFGVDPEALAARLAPELARAA